MKPNQILTNSTLSAPRTYIPTGASNEYNKKTEKKKVKEAASIHTEHIVQHLHAKVVKM